MKRFQGNLPLSALAGASLSILVSCGGAGGALQPRFVAVHNAMAVSGLAQTGAISEGSLGGGDHVHIPVELSDDQCYTFVGFGHGGAEDIGLEVLDSEGEVLARDLTHDVQAALQVCPDEEGEHTLSVTMVHGDGGYTVSSWSGDLNGGSSRGARGTCERPRSLELGQAVHGETTGGTAAMIAPCVRGPAPEVVYEIEVETRGLLRAHLASNYDGVLYLLRTCGQPQSSIACNDDSPDTNNSRIAATVEPGTYYLVVDGFGSAAGSYELTVEVNELQSLGEVCAEAPALESGVAVNGDTGARPDYFHSTCAGGSQSPDNVYRLNVAETSRYRLRQTSGYDGSLYVRATCEEPTSELACNDDYGDTRHSHVQGVLEPGEYFVYSDGYQSGNSGTYTLTADLGPAAGVADTPGNTCASALALEPGEIRPDTFRATDDFTASCGGAGAADVVYSLNVEQRSRLSVAVGRHEFTGLISVRRACDDAETEVACGTERTLTTNLDAGQYFVIIDGAAPDAFGEAVAQIRLEDLAGMERTCRRAPMLRPGRSVSGDTQGNANQFTATCAGGAASGDTVYRLRLRRRSHVIISSDQQYDGAIYIRSDCMDIGTEVACNDDAGDNRHSRIERNLDAGTYYVFVDGFQANSQGEFNLDVEVGEPRATPPPPPRPTAPPGLRGMRPPGGGAK